MARISIFSFDMYSDSIDLFLLWDGAPVSLSRGEGIFYCSLLTRCPFVKSTGPPISSGEGGGEKQNEKTNK